MMDSGPTFGDYLVERVCRELCRQNNLDPDYTPKGWSHPNWMEHRFIRASNGILEAVFGRRFDTNKL